MKKINNKIKVLVLLGLGVISLTSCGLTRNSTSLNPTNPDKIIENIINNITQIDKDVSVSEISNSITDVYKKVSKGCIGVYSKGETSYSTGSGVIFKEENGLYYAVTNEHVVDEGSSFMAYFGDGIYVNATLIGKDSTNDVAVISFSLDDFPSIKKEVYIIPLENNTLLSIGETALAIGCPLSMTEHFNNLTSGIVSNISNLEISIDTPVNSGNSGGGLFNLKGELIGLVYKKDTYSSGSSRVPVDCMGYAIPLDIVSKAVNDILTLNGDIERPTIGITVTTVSTLLENNNYEIYSKYLPSIDNKYNYVIITDVSSNTPASKAGLQANDVLLEIGGYEINSLSDISYRLHQMLKTDSTTLKIYRSSTGETVTIVVNLNNN